MEHCSCRCINVEHAVALLEQQASRTQKATVALLLAVGSEWNNHALPGITTTEGLGAQDVPAPCKKQSGRQRSGAAEGDAPDSLRRSGRQRRPARHAPSASPQPRGRSSSACMPGVRKASGQQVGMAPLPGAQPPQHTSGLSGTLPTTPKRQETTAGLKGTWTHVGTPPSCGQAAGLNTDVAAAGTRRFRTSHARHLALAEPSASAQPPTSPTSAAAAATAPVPDAPTAAEARQGVPVLEANITGEPAPRAEATSEGFASQSLSVLSVQPEAATSAMAAAELRLALQPIAAAEEPFSVLLRSELGLTAHLGQASQQPAGRAAEEGSLGESQRAAPTQLHLADETCSAELCRSVRSGRAVQLPQQQVPDGPTGAPLRAPDMHAAVAAQPKAQQEVSTKDTMEVHSHEPFQEPEYQAAGRPSEGAQVTSDASEMAAAQHGAEHSPSADTTVVPGADEAVEKPELKGAFLLAEQPQQAEPISISKNPLRALPDSFTAQVPASRDTERAFSRRRSVALSGMSASKSRPPIRDQPAGGATPDVGRPALAPGKASSATVRPAGCTDCPCDAAPSAPIPDSAPWHGALSRTADRAAPASPESHLVPAQQPEGTARKGSAAASQLQERSPRPRDTARGRPSGQPSAKRIQPAKLGKRTGAAAGARTAAGRQQAIKSGLGCSKCRFARRGCSTCRRKPAAALRQKAAEQASRPTIAPPHASAAEPEPELHFKVGARANEACGCQPDDCIHIM